jgi:hypothetical protein
VVVGGRDGNARAVAVLAGSAIAGSRRGGPRAGGVAAEFRIRKARHDCEMNVDKRMERRRKKLVRPRLVEKGCHWTRDAQSKVGGRLERGKTGRAAGNRFI